MTKIAKKLKSNKGFTIQDTVIGLLVLVMFAGIIGSSFLAVYRIQCETKITAMATLYGIQIFENIDKIPYEEVKNEKVDDYKKDFKIPDMINIKVEVTPKNEEDTIKLVELTMDYTFGGKTETILLQKIKVKEL